MQKGNVLIFLLVGIVVLAAIGGAFYFGRSTSPKPSPTPAATSQTTPSPAQDASRKPNGSAETTSWNTYTSDKYNFSVKYPLTWSYTEVESTSLGFIRDKDIMYEGLKETDIEFFESTRQGAPEGAVYLTGGLVRLRVTRDQSLNNIGVEEFSGFYPSLSWKDVNVGVGIKGRAVRHTLCQSAECYSVFFKQNSTIFEFSVEAELGGTNNSRQVQQDYLESMLNTFKFTQ